MSPQRGRQSAARPGGVEQGVSDKMPMVAEVAKSFFRSRKKGFSHVLHGEIWHRACPARSRGAHGGDRQRLLNVGEAADLHGWSGGLIAQDPAG